MHLLFDAWALYHDFNKLLINTGPGLDIEHQDYALYQDTCIWIVISNSVALYARSS